MSCLEVVSLGWMGVGKGQQGDGEARRIVAGKVGPQLKVGQEKRARCGAMEWSQGENVVGAEAPHILFKRVSGKDGEVTLLSQCLLRSLGRQAVICETISWKWRVSYKEDLTDISMGEEIAMVVQGMEEMSMVVVLM